MSYTIHNGDCVSVLAGMDENIIDTCITDPPYELGFMGKRWDSSGVACVQTGREFIGIEREPDYADIAEKRIAEAQKQPRLI